MNGFDKVTISREKHCFYAGSKDTVYMTPLCRKMALVPIVCVGLRISAPWTVGKVPPILHQSIWHPSQNPTLLPPHHSLPRLPLPHPSLPRIPFPPHTSPSAPKTTISHSTYHFGQKERCSVPKVSWSRNYFIFGSDSGSTFSLISAPAPAPTPAICCHLKLYYYSRTIASSKVTAENMY